MPELPEVETVKNTLKPLLNQRLKKVVVKQSNLRVPVVQDELDLLIHHKIISMERRAKYILIQFDTPQHDFLIFHLGMTGRIKLMPYINENDYQYQNHDHVFFEFEDYSICYNDPRRFGVVVYAKSPVFEHTLLKNLGVEPLTENFTPEFFYNAIRKKTTEIKVLLLQTTTVVGVGNIYASESLFRSNINPTLPSKNLTLDQCKILVKNIKDVLTEAIRLGGSSIRDFVDSNGESGYFQQTYFVYNREHQPCKICETPIETIQQAQRTTFFCPKCQSIHQDTNENLF